MADKRSHRGPHPEDAQRFDASALPSLKEATSDYCMLLDRGYPPTGTLTLVGDRYRLTKRQRIAVSRSSCTSDSESDRRSREMTAAQAAGASLQIDGFNLLVTVEASLSGGVVLVGREGCYRDLASMHGTYRRVDETAEAIALVGQTLAELDVERCHWLLDKPVSNSGRLKTMLLETAARGGWQWDADLVNDPDKVLSASTEPVVSADSMILDRCGPWLNLAKLVIDAHVENAWIVDLPDN